MFGAILAFITGLAPAFFQFGSKLVDLQAAKVNAQSEEEKKRIDAQIEEVHDKRAVLVAEAGSRINGFMRFFLALGPAVILAKIYIWDKTIGPFNGCVGKIPLPGCEKFNTDALDPNLWWVVIAVIGFYFVTSMVKK